MSLARTPNHRLATTHHIGLTCMVLCLLASGAIAGCGDGNTSTDMGLGELLTDTAGDQSTPGDATDVRDTAPGDIRDAADVPDGVDTADAVDLMDGEDADLVAPLQVHTELGANGELWLRTNAPARVADCRTGVVDCTDADGDGLVDAWEHIVLQRTIPLLRFDEAEQLLDDPIGVVAGLGRVTPVFNQPRMVRVFIMLGYHRDYGTCAGVTSHNGDSERVGLELARPTIDAGDAEVLRFYTAAHEGTATDHSAVHPASDPELQFVADPIHGEPRWMVFPSANKHATYISGAVCEAIAAGVPCVDEDCSPDNVANPARYDRVPPVSNAGEPEMPLLTDLTSIGFPGEQAWADQRFCGGLMPDGCSSPVVEKLTVDPFR